MFAKILIANRGEIAVRIIRAARSMGISTVATFSEADAKALHVRLADERFCIGPALPRQSYLNADAIIAAAVASGADGIHPGYGFLSESADFARAVEEAGMRFIGPRSETLVLMSDKVEARRAAVAAGVPVLPGSDEKIEDQETAHRTARSIGYPVAVKASFGGGGRGMRIVTDETGLEEAITAARRESEAAFARSEIFIEKYLPRPRHVEVQILGDDHGNVLQLGDRDCTVQRRHQKLIEEAPAPDIAPDLRGQIRSTALTLARRVNYVGAGTVEFLLDPATNQFYFLEMNTRLQVEHGVTELVTGIDIVEQQIRIAAGAALDFEQDGVRTNGHAIEARIAAENPWEGFAPNSGTVSRIDVPLSPWTRGDFGIESGDRIEPFYDSLIGKLLAWGPSREAALARLVAALGELRIDGLASTAPYLTHVLVQPEFIECRHFTGSVEHDWPARQFEPPKSRSSETIEAGVDAVSERQAVIPGTPQGSIAIYGAAPSLPLFAVPSVRGVRVRATGSEERGSAARKRSITSPMDCVLVQTKVDAGAEVMEGDTLLVLEAMKMEVVIRASVSGIIRNIISEAGSTIRKGEVIVEFE